MKNALTDAIKYVILLLTITSLNALEVNRIEGIDGYVHDLEFDYNGNIYGFDEFPKSLNSTSETSSDREQAIRFFFKIDDKKKLVWKIPFGNPPFAAGDIFRRFLFPKTRILINRKNDVYLVNDKGDSIEIYTPKISDGDAVLEKLSQFSIDKGQNYMRQAIIVDENIIVSVGNVPHETSTLRLFKINSGKWVYITRNNQFDVVKDKQGNIYFVSNRFDPYLCDFNDCDFSDCRYGKTSKKELYVLTRDSFKEDRPKPRAIYGARNDKEELTALTANEEDEIYLELRDDDVACDVKIKKMANSTFNTVFSGSEKSALLLKAIRKGVVVKYEDIPIYDNHDTILYYRHDTSFTFLNASMSSNNHTTDKSCDFPRNSEKFSDIGKVSDVLPDKQGNIFFDATRKPSKTRFFYLNRTKHYINKISFDGDTSLKLEMNPPYFSMLLDEKDNAFFGLQGRPTGLYYLKRGIFAAKKILNYDVLLLMKKSRNGDIFITTDAGLHFVSMHK